MSDRVSVLRPRPLRVLTALVLSALVATALAVPHTSATATEVDPEPPAQDRPNILLVTTDDQATTDMRFMPFTRKFFADNGVTFTDAVSPYPLCCPARATILTGQLSHNHGVLTNLAPYGGYAAFADSVQEDAALPTWLPENYRTMFVGKYLNGYGPRAYENSGGPPPGWDTWHATAGPGVYSFNHFHMYDGDGNLDPFTDDPETDEEEVYQTYVVGEQTRAFIDESAAAGEPFFIWESNLAPHAACSRDGFGSGCHWTPPEPAEQDENRYRRLRLNRPREGSFNERVVGEKPAHVRRKGVWGRDKLARKTTLHRQRARSLRAVDRSFQETVAKLEDTGEDTLVIFTSDNGYLIGQHRWSGKTLPYQPSLGVPMMMAWVGAPEEGLRLPAGQKVHDTVALVDVAPTVADAAGLVQADLPLTTDGRSMLPVAAGAERGYGALSIEAGPQRPKDWPTWFYRGVRTQRYTYAWYPALREAELYDRRRDPHEMNNVAYRPAYRATRAGLADKLRRLRRCDGPECYRVGARVPRPRAERYLTNGATVHPDELGGIGRARQVVTVTARNWRTGRGRLTAWVRHRRTWAIRRGPVRVQLGGRGLARERFRRGTAAETPAGTFRPHSAFGLKRRPATGLRYRRVGRRDQWVVDRRDRRTYNTHQQRRRADATWRRRFSVRWAQYGNRFHRALLMDYNLPRRVRHSRRFHELRAGSPAKVGKGSFILHAGRRLGRHGWVSMRPRHLHWLLRWVRPRRGTTFVVGTPGYLRRRL